MSQWIEVHGAIPVLPLHYIFFFCFNFVEYREVVTIDSIDILAAMGQVSNLIDSLLNVERIFTYLSLAV